MYNYFIENKPLVFTNGLFSFAYLSNTEISNWSNPPKISFIIAVIFAQSPSPLPSTLRGILGSCKD